MCVATGSTCPQAHPTAPDLRGAIGVFDSGVGGLSVLRAIRQALPHENLVYVADTGHAPYGDKPTAHIVARTLKVGRWLSAQGVRAITLACNTATVLAVTQLRQSTHLPVVAIEPAIKPAVAQSARGVVGVLATQQTIQSAGVAHLIERFAQGKQILLQACPGWVERVEQGDLDSPATLKLLRQHTQALVDAGADVWVLGCTHYPFLQGALRQIAGPGVTLIDPAQAVARELQRRLAEQDPQPPSDGMGLDFFYTTGDAVTAQRVMGQLWGRSVQVRSLTD